MDIKAEIVGVEAEVVEVVDVAVVEKETGLALNRGNSFLLSICSFSFRYTNRNLSNGYDALDHNIGIEPLLPCFKF